MSHVNDGELHAYLDGALHEVDRERAGDVEAHLRLCADCRARLEDARRISRRAHAILSSVAPTSIELPPFEEIEAAADRSARAEEGGERSIAPTGARTSRRPSWALGRMAGLAWAASVAFALAVGWQGRQLWRPPAEALPGAMNERLSPTTTPASDADENRSAETEGEPSVVFDDRAGARRSADRPLEPAAEQPADVQKRDAATAGASGGAVERFAEERRDAAFAPEPDTRPAARSNEVAARARQVGGQKALPQAAAAAEPEEQAELGAGRDAFYAAEAAESGELWLPVDVDDAEHWLEAPVLSVPNVPVEDVAISTRDGERAVRVRQRLESGVLVELIEAREATETRMEAPVTTDELRVDEEKARAAGEAEADAAAQGAVAAPEADPLKNVPSVASVRRDGLRITARAPLALDSLRRLLSRLR